MLVPKYLKNSHVALLCSENRHFLTLPLISQKLMMVERQTIPHLNALVVGSKILGGLLCIFFRGCHTTSSLKSVFFTRKVAWSSLIKLHGCSWDILEPTSRPLKWVIICLSSISGSLSNQLFTKYSNPLNQYIRSAVYSDRLPDNFLSKLRAKMLPLYTIKMLLTVTYSFLIVIINNLELVKVNMKLPNSL